MILPANITIDIVAGQTPGQLAAVLRLESDDGRVYDQAAPTPLQVGNTITYGPIAVEIQLPCEFGHGKTPPPPAGGTGGGKGPVKPGK